MHPSHFLHSPSASLRRRDALRVSPASSLHGTHTCLVPQRPPHRRPRPLSQACEGSHALGVVCVSPEDYSPTALGFAKAGPFRARFRLESIAALQEAWSERGGTLLVRVAPARVAVPELARAWGATRVVCHEHATREEIDEEAAVERGLERDNLSLERTWGATLYHPADVPPFEDGFPRVFTRFRKACEKGALVRPPLDPPATIPGPGADVPASDPLPTLASLGLDEPPLDARAYDLRGGEAAARARVSAWAWDDDALGRYKETRNGLLGQGYSSVLALARARLPLSPPSLRGRACVRGRARREQQHILADL